MKALTLAALLCAAATISSAATQPHAPTLGAHEALRAMGIAAPRIAPQSNMSCGLKPLPPLGCKVGPCMCDANGNCEWKFICS